MAMVALGGLYVQSIVLLSATYRLLCLVLNIFVDCAGADINLEQHNTDRMCDSYNIMSAFESM